MSEETPMPAINFDDFTKVDIRAGRITAAEPVPKSKKLLKLTVDFGGAPTCEGLGTRQILAGIAESYAPEQVIDRIAAFVVNLAPRKMMGLESHGMILAAANFPETQTVSIVFLSALVPIGTRIG